MDGLIQVVTTAGEKQVAQSIAAELVAQRLAACVQVSGPVTSTYRWQGEVETAEEWLCTAKTTRSLFGEVERVVHELHPYDTPELIATAIVAASGAYEAWLREQVRRD